MQYGPALQALYVAAAALAVTAASALVPGSAGRLVRRLGMLATGAALLASLFLLGLTASGTLWLDHPAQASMMVAVLVAVCLGLMLWALLGGVEGPRPVRRDDDDADGRGDGGDPRREPPLSPAPAAPQRPGPSGADWEGFDDARREWERRAPAGVR